MGRIGMQSNLKFAQSKPKFQVGLGKIEILISSNTFSTRIEILVLTRQN